MAALPSSREQLTRVNDYELQGHPRARCVRPEEEPWAVTVTKRQTTKISAGHGISRWQRAAPQTFPKLIVRGSGRFVSRVDQAGTRRICR